MIPQKRDYSMRKPMFLSALALIVLASSLWAATPSHSAAGQAGAIASTFGTVQARGYQGWGKAFRNQALFDGQTVRTGSRSRAEIRYQNGAITRLGSNTLLRVRGTQDMRLLRGKTWIKKPKNAQRMTIRTPIAVASIVGTELFISHSDNNTSHVTTLNGVVEVTGELGDKQTVNPGEWVEIEPGKPLEKPTKFDWNTLKKQERFLIDPDFIPAPDEPDNDEDWK
jgi:hypothetical protein